MFPRAQVGKGHGLLVCAQHGGVPACPRPVPSAVFPLRGLEQEAQPGQSQVPEVWPWAACLMPGLLA